MGKKVYTKEEYYQMLERILKPPPAATEIFDPEVAEKLRALAQQQKRVG